MSSTAEPDRSLMKTLNAAEKKVLVAFEGREDEILSPKTIGESGDFSGDVEVMNALSWLRSKHLVTMREIVRKHYSLDKEGKEVLEKGTPEWIAVKLLHEKNEMSISDLGPVLRKNVSVAIGWLRKKSWATIRKEEGETILTITEEGKAAVEQGSGEGHDGEGMDGKAVDDVKRSDGKDGEGVDPDHALLELVEKGLLEDDVASDQREQLDALTSRKGIVKVRELVFREASLTPKGKDFLAMGIEIRPEISAITPELIKSGKWKEVDIRPYDVQAFAPRIRRGTLHPLTILMEEIREIFVSMGFTEIQGEYMESCFWNMDALFIPQDHPARELQDTFYLKRPEKFDLGGENDSNTNADLIEKVKAIHENGGDTGSTGWEYIWSKEEAERSLLRTHTTVNTIRYLSQNPEPPVKVFSLGRVFRKEAIDSTHLPEFHQIEGILMEEGASFGMLIGLLKEFYSRMGFDEIRFRPGYFPYTEPSMEVEVRFHGKWLELGGSGIFRKEVTSPFGLKYPVLAWGLGLERLAMLRLGLKDIRELYISDIDWLQDVEGQL